MTTPRTITAEHVLLALVARKARPGTRWAAMSNHVVTGSCKRSLTPTYRLPNPPILCPMNRGNFGVTVARVVSQGRREVLATFGTGVRAITAEARRHVLEA